MDWPAAPGAPMPMLREGTNGWTCLPDDPTSPTLNDPQCLDKQFLNWTMALMAGEASHTTEIGIGYMLQGGVVADNDDPSVLTLPPGQGWQVDPPHVMVIMLTPIDESQIGTDPRYGRPWVMFADTPFEHIMISVR
jgi:hypothetical protein